MSRDKLKRLEQNINVLKKMKTETSLDDILNDKLDDWALRYGLFESIQLIIDLSCKMVSDRNLGAPKKYSDCIKLLIQNHYLENELGKKLLKMIGLRNLLVHEYAVIDPERLYSYLSNVDDFELFFQQIKSNN